MVITSHNYLRFFLTNEAPSPYLTYPLDIVKKTDSDAYNTAPRHLHKKHLMLTVLMLNVVESKVQCDVIWWLASVAALL